MWFIWIQWIKSFNIRFKHQKEKAPYKSALFLDFCNPNTPIKDPQQGNVLWDEVLKCLKLSSRPPGRCVSFRFCSNWIDVRVKGTSLPRALHCWDRSLQESNHTNSSHVGHNRKKHKTPPARGCPFHLFDSCSWPHCNPTCPAIYDEATGQEVSAIQVLKYMGLDVQQTARQQGMDPRTLLEMLSNGSWDTFLQGWRVGMVAVQRTTGTRTGVGKKKTVRKHCLQSRLGCWKSEWFSKSFRFPMTCRMLLN